MKKLFLLLLLFTNICLGQTIIFSEDIRTPTGTTTLSNYVIGTTPATFQNISTLTYSNGAQTNPADIRISSPSTTYSGASGGGNVWFTNTFGVYGFSIESINASNYTSLTLEYGYRKERASLHSTFSVDYWNGSTWQTIANTSSNLFNETITSGTGWYKAKTLSLPIGAQINGLKIRFVKTGTTEIRIDDIILKGTPCIAPTISSISPISGPIGTIVRINASSGNLTGATARVGGVNATVLSSTPTQLVIVIPSGTSSGGIIINDTQPCAVTTDFTFIIRDLTSCEGISGTYTDLMISEIYDTQSGSGGVIELYNGTGSPIDMGAGIYKLRRYANFLDTGAPTIERALTGIINSGQIILVRADATVICATQVGTPYATLGSGFNSDDRIELTKSVTNTVIDQVQTRNNTGFSMIRVSLTGPSATFSDTDWNSNDTENCANLGIFDSTPPTPPSISIQPSVSLSCTSTNASLSVTATEGFVGSNPLAYQWYVVAPNMTVWSPLTNTGIYTGSTSATLTISSITGLNGYQYYCQVRENTSTCYFSTTAVQLSNGGLIWNGSDWRDTNNVLGVPSITKEATINGAYNTTSNGSFDCCSLIVNSNFLLEITDSRYVKIQNDLTVSGTLNVLNNGSLVQVNDSGENSGNITYNRTVSSLNGYDYIYWSSPTTSSPLLQTLSSLYNTPSPGFQYQWNPTVTNTNSTFGNWEGASSMIPGRGYIMRASSSYGWTGTLTSQFVGMPNNGVITCPLEGITLLSTESYSNLASFPTLGTFNRLYRETDTGLEYYWNGSTYIISTSLDSSFTNNRWNLVGNPYPSSIRALSFLTSNNNIDGFVNIWTHGTAPISTTSPYYQSFQYNYTSNDYITYNATGLSSGPTGFNGYIASGQGFLVNLLQANTPTSNIVFNNSMRSETYSNSQFYRTSENNNEGRIWLDLLNTNNIPTRLLVGYKEDATIERDRLYDAITNQDFYTTINNDKFIIQGRPDFNENDQVNLGINIPTAGEYKIAIAETDGILTTQNIYLQDLYSNTIHDLTQSPYTFNSVSGTFNDRFILRYTNNSLGNNDFVINNTIIYNKDNKINIDSNKIIKNVKVYDITGKLLYDNDHNSNNIKIYLECSKQILFVKIKTEDDQVITRKILNE